MPSIYHFTDFENLESIVASGALRCHRAAPTKVDIGDQGIKSNRQNIAVGCGPGGRVCDYVPFYFAPRSPMLYKIQRGGVEGVDPNQARVVYLVTTTDAMYDAGLGCVFSDGNAASYSITRFEDDRQKLETHVDWRLMRATMWNNTLEDPDRMRRRMAEFLVHNEVPIELVSELGVFNVAVRDALVDALDGQWSVPLNVRRGWYF